jgi:hypothetical protein
MSGELIMQRNPTRVLTGEKPDAVGPGDYNPVYMKDIRVKKKGLEWWKARGPRLHEEAANTGPALGPGTYSVQT